MKKMFIILNHSLSKEQEIDAKEKLNADEFVNITKPSWSAIDPYKQDISEYLFDYKNELKEKANKGDYLLVQGDMGATYKMIEFAKSIGLIPVYATTKRETVEIIKDGETVKQSVFKHCIFRLY